MRGGGHSNYIHDDVKRERWARELAERQDIQPDELLGYFRNEWIRAVDLHQRRLGAISLAKLIEQPFSRPKDEEDSRLMKLAGNNSAMYGDDIEDAIYEDPLMDRLIEMRQQHTGDEDYSHLMRARRTVIAYMLHAAAEDHSAA